MIESKIKTGNTASLNKPLERLPTMYVKDCGYIPVVLTNAAFVIEKNITTKSLFQTQGNISKVNASLNRLAAPRLSKMKDDNVHDIIEAMKTFLVRLPEPLLPESVCEALMTTTQAEDFTSHYITVLTKFRNTSPHNFAILHFVMQLLKKISEHSEHNSMDVQKLATVFVLDVIKPLKLEDAHEHGLILIERMQRLPYMIMVVENMINQVEIFKTIVNIKSVAPSPKGSMVSMTKSISGMSPRRCKSNATGELRPHSETRDFSHASKTELYDDSTKSEASEGPKNNRKNVFENRTKKKLTSGSLDLSTKAALDSQKESGRSLEVSRQSVTDIPLQIPSTGSRMNCALKDSSKITKDCVTSKGEEAVNSIEVSLEPETEMSRNPALASSQKEVKDKPHIIPRTPSVGGKNSRSTLTSMSPGKKKAGKKEHDETFHNTSEAKSNRSSDNKIGSTLEKRKRKSRSTSKKSKHDQERSVVDNFCDFTIFQPDEEITPWNEGSTNSDDSSVMVKTIRNPRILAYKSSTPVNIQKEVAETVMVPKSRERVISSEKVSQMFLVNSWFRTISSQNKTSVVSESSNTSASSAASYCMNIMLSPEPEACDQFTSSETTPISKDLIRGVKLKGSVGVNTSPCPQISTTPAAIEEDQDVPETRKILQTPTSAMVCQKEPLTGLRFSRTESCKNLTAMHTASFANALTYNGNSICGHGSASGFTLNGVQKQASRTVFPNQIINSSTRNERIGTQVRFRQQQVRNALKCSSYILQQKCGDNVMKCTHSQRIPFGEWFVDIILVCITLFCISLIFFFHEYSKASDGW